MDNRHNRHWVDGCAAGSVVLALLVLLSPPAQALAPPATSAEGAVGIAGQVIRELRDPCLGSLWALVVDLRHPEWPGKWILLERGGAGDSSVASPAQPLPKAIRTGDHVRVEQETPVLRAQLQAVALESAGVGQAMRVRLSAGADSTLGIYGKVIVVTATGAGEARWPGVAGSRP